MSDDLAFEPTQLAQETGRESRGSPKFRERLQAGGFFDKLRWRAAARDAVWWALALGTTSGVMFGLVSSLGGTGVQKVQPEGFVLTGLLYVSMIAWLVGGGVAIASAWRSVEEPGWWQRGWWMVIVLSGLSGVVPYATAIGGGLVLSPGGGLASLVPDSLGVWGNLLRAVVLTGLGWGLVTVAGVLIPVLWRGFRWPVLAGVSASMGYAFTVHRFIAGWGGREFSEWGAAILGSFTSVPVAALVLWSICKEELEAPDQMLRGLLYLVGIVLLWGGLEAITVGLHTAAVAVWG